MIRGKIHNIKHVEHEIKSLQRSVKQNSKGRDL